MIWLRHHRQAFLLALFRLRTTPLNTLLSLAAIGIALTLPAVGWMLQGNALQLLAHAAPTPQLSLFMTLGASRADAKEIEKRLRHTAGVLDVRLLAREDTLQRLKSAEAFSDVLDALPDNPFPDAFIIEPNDELAASPQGMENLARDLRRWNKVEHVQLDSAWVKRLNALLRVGRAGVLALAALLGAGLAAIVFNTIRLQVVAKQAEIELSRLLGATNAWINRPFHYQGMIQGLLGAALAWLLTWLATLGLDRPAALLGQVYGLTIKLQSLPLQSAFAMLGGAAALGWIGAAFSLATKVKPK